MTDDYAERLRALREGEKAMDDQRLNQVIENLEAAALFKPNGSKALVPRPDSVQQIIDDAARLNSDLSSVIDERIAFWQAEKKAMAEFGEWLMKASQKTADELSRKIDKDYKLAKTVADALAEHKREDNEQVPG